MDTCTQKHKRAFDSTISCFQTRIPAPQGKEERGPGTGGSNEEEDAYNSVDLDPIDIAIGQHVAGGS